MALIGFLMLIIGGGLLLYSAVDLALDPALATLLGDFINTIIGAPLGTQIAGALVYVTSLGGIFVIIGAIIWYAAGSGIFATIGRIIVSIATFTAFYSVVNQVLIALGLGVFSQPIEVILAYFLGLGIGFASVILVLIGNFIGAGRKKKIKEYSEESEGA